MPQITLTQPLTIDQLTEIVAVINDSTAERSKSLGCSTSIFIDSIGEGSLGDGGKQIFLGITLKFYETPEGLTKLIRILELVKSFDPTT